MINVEQHRKLIVRPVLEHLGMYSLAAENLIIGTAAHESRLEYLAQIKGPALGVYQCEPATHQDIWDEYLAYRADLASKVRALASQHWFEQNPDRELIGNLPYATAICRIHYRRIKQPLPAPDDLWGLANYWKAHYNTALGRGTVEQFYNHYPTEKDHY